MKDARFEWDEDKDRENQAKHGVSFALAQLAFLDPGRVIAEDTGTQYQREAVLLHWEGRWGHPDSSFHGARGCDSRFRRRLLAKGEADL